MSRFVLALTGPAGSGKSTVAEKLAKQLPRCVNVDVDHVKDMIPSGFYADKNNPDNPEGWGFSEWGLVGDSLGLLAAHFQKAGYDVIINGYLGEPGWDTLSNHIKLTHRVLLMPESQEAVKRDQQRPIDKSLGEPSIIKHYQHFQSHPDFSGFIKLDTTHQSVEDTAAVVNKLLSRHSS